MTERRLAAAGVSAPLPPGWEGGVRRAPAPAGPAPLAPTAVPSAGVLVPPGDLVVLHLANVPLPARRGDFGSAVVAGLGPSGAFVCLVEYEPEAADTPLFGRAPLPRTLGTGDLSPDFVRNGGPDQSGAQRFGVAAGRPFCLYVVVGSHRLRRLLLPDVNAVLAGLDVQPRPS